MDALSLFFPKKCLECGLPAQAGKEGRYICNNCLKKVPLGGWTRVQDIVVYSIWRYRGVIRKAIIALKYKYATDIADELVNQVNLNLVPSAYCLTPIPLHWYRKNFRGFNQTELLGEKLAKKMVWKFIPDLLIRNKLTTPQVELKGEDRRKNLCGVFALNPDYSSFSVRSSIVLFDDVFTTGSTLAEAAKVLKKAGVKKVWGLTIAR